MFLDSEKKEEIPCFCNYLFSFLFNIDTALLLSLYDRMKKIIYRRLLNEIPFSIFIRRDQSRIGLSRKLLSENTFHN